MVAPTRHKAGQAQADQHEGVGFWFGHRGNVEGDGHAVSAGGRGPAELAAIIGATHEYGVVAGAQAEGLADHAIRKAVAHNAILEAQGVIGDGTVHGNSSRWPDFAETGPARTMRHDVTGISPVFQWKRQQPPS